MIEENLIDGIATSRISRRSVIKAGAIVGGTVWVAPVIDSFVNRAAAQSNPACAGRTCATFTVYCNGGSPCVCATTATGGGYCVDGSTSCGSLSACSATNTCPSGYTCLVNTCCGTPVCYPNNIVCSPGDPPKSQAQTSTAGTTIGH